MLLVNCLLLAASSVLATSAPEGYAMQLVRRGVPAATTAAAPAPTNVYANYPGAPAGTPDAPLGYGLDATGTAAPAANTGGRKYTATCPNALANAMAAPVATPAIAAVASAPTPTGYSGSLPQAVAPVLSAAPARPAVSYTLLGLLLVLLV